jgi:hypothetical protein
VTQTFGPLQAEGTGGSGGLPRTGYTDTSPSIFLGVSPASIISGFLIPLTLLIVVFSFHQASGWPLDLSIAHCVHLMFG